GLALLVPLAMLAVLVIALAPGLIVVFLPGGSAVTVIGAILLVIGVLLAGVGCLAVYFGYWAVAAPALLLENLGVIAAVRRSFQLVRGGFWRVLGIGLLTAVVTAVVRQVFV